MSMCPDCKRNLPCPCDEAMAEKRVKDKLVRAGFVEVYTLERLQQEIIKAVEAIKRGDGEAYDGACASIIVLASNLRRRKSRQ